MLAGLTGNIGSGKTTVLGMFAKLGACIASADEIVSRILAEEAIKKKIRSLLGDMVFCEDGSLDKKKTAEIVFDNPELRKRLEGIVHPAVMIEIRRFAQNNDRAGKVAIAEIPLLFEGGFNDEVDQIITVTAPQALVYERLEKKGALSKEDIAKRLACQFPDEQKTAKSDYVIINEGDIISTERQVMEIYRSLQLSHLQNLEK